MLRKVSFTLFQILPSGQPMLASIGKVEATIDNERHSGRCREAVIEGNDGGIQGIKQGLNRLCTFPSDHDYQKGRGVSTDPSQGHVSSPNLQTGLGQHIL